MPQSELSIILNVLRETLLPSTRYLLAVSGGVDSICLLHGVASLQEELKLHFEVAHVDHGIREESGEDRRVVEELARQLEIPCHVLSLSGPPSGRNVEAWGREERYHFFRDLLLDHRLDTILTAHHRDDLIETFLMRILSNKVPRALKGEHPEWKMIRPFLQLSKEELYSYAKEYHLECCEDETNANQAFLRNRVRHSLLPQLQEGFGMGVKKQLFDQAIALDEELGALDTIAESFHVRLQEYPFGTREWLSELRTLLQTTPSPVGDRLLKQLFLPYTGSPLGRASSGLLREFFLSGEVAIQLPGNIEIRRRAGGVSIFTNIKQRS